MAKRNTLGKGLNKLFTTDSNDESNVNDTKKKVSTTKEKPVKEKEVVKEVVKEGHQVMPARQQYLSAVRNMQAQHRFHQHRLTRARLTDDHVHFAVTEVCADIFQHRHALKALDYILNLYHQFSIKLVNTTSSNRITILEFTTAFVLALPTSSAPP